MAIEYKNNEAAPVVYFDATAALVGRNGIFMVELAARVLTASCARTLRPEHP